MKSLMWVAVIVTILSGCAARPLLIRDPLRDPIVQGMMGVLHTMVSDHDTGRLTQALLTTGLYIHQTVLAYTKEGDYGTARLTLDALYSSLPVSTETALTPYRVQAIAALTGTSEVAAQQQPQGAVAHLNGVAFTAPFAPAPLTVAFDLTWLIDTTAGAIGPALLPPWIVLATLPRGAILATTIYYNRTSGVLVLRDESEKSVPAWLVGSDLIDFTFSREPDGNTILVTSTSVGPPATTARMVLKWPMTP